MADKYVIKYRKPGSVISETWCTHRSFDSPEEAMKWAQEKNLVDPEPVLKEDALASWRKWTYGAKE